MSSIEKSISILRGKDVRWVHTVFTDIRGMMQDVVIPARRYTDGSAFNDGIPFDGSSVRGFKPIDESDMVLRPDPGTLSVLPWIDGGQNSAIVTGDVYESYGGSEPSGVCSRHVAKRAVAAAQDMGFLPKVGTEMEHFVFGSIDPTNLSWDLWVSPSGGEGDSWGAPRVIPKSIETTPGQFVLRPKEGYGRPPPIDSTVDYRNEVSSILEDCFGFEVEVHHHEVAIPGQVEIDCRYDELVRTADGVIMTKFVAKNVAKRRGLIATFMPKPVYLDNASGMHVHSSLWREDKNAMYDSSDEYAELSQTARYFIGGLLNHARAVVGVTCPTVNSYKRLVPGFEAPIFIVWSRRNRSALVRIPVYYRGPRFSSAKRVEFRGADPSCNPYLGLACVLMAGLDGIKKKIDPGDPVDADVYKLTPAKRREMGIGELPTTLREAIDAMKSDELVEKTLGSHIFDAMAELRTKEWSQYCLYITPWEIMKYLDI